MRQLVSVDAMSRHPIERIRHNSLLYPELPNGKTHDKIKPKFNQIKELPILNINNNQFFRFIRVYKDMGGYRVLVIFCLCVLVTTPPKNFPHLKAQFFSETRISYSCNQFLSIVRPKSNVLQLLIPHLTLGNRYGSEYSGIHPNVALALAFLPVLQQGYLPTLLAAYRHEYNRMTLCGAGHLMAISPPSYSTHFRYITAT